MTTCLLSPQERTPAEKPLAAQLLDTGLQTMGVKVCCPLICFSFKHRTVYLQ